MDYVERKSVRYVTSMPVACEVRDCNCHRVLEVRVTETNGSQVIERKYERQCPLCGHAPGQHLGVPETPPHVESHSAHAST